MTLRDIPNLITLLRILLVPPLVVWLANEDYTVALWLFLFTGASDAIDGFLARWKGWTSPLGAVLDPLADKLLLVSTYVTLGWLGHLPLWLVTAVIARDGVIIAGALTYYRVFGKIDIEPTHASKLNTVLQIVLVVALIFSLAVVPLREVVIEALIVIVGVTTAFSGIQYVWIWGRRAWADRKGAGR